MGLGLEDAVGETVAEAELVEEAQIPEVELHLAKLPS